MSPFTEELAYYDKYLKEHSKDNIISKEEVIKRLEKGEPIQYILGEVNFYGYPIKVSKHVLIPRFETELLVEKTLKKINKYFKNENIDILDMGTGSGCIAISLKHNLPSSNIFALDISKEALSIAKKNALDNKTNITFIESDMTTYKDKLYDVIISNPPYISYEEPIMELVKNNEPHLALYSKDNGLYFYKKIIDNIKYITKDKYLICFEIGYNESTAIVDYAKSKLTNINIYVEKDYSLKERFIFITNIN
jgi:protein-(glutamine-N5) methyltransferase, release factor-specific